MDQCGYVLAVERYPCTAVACTAVAVSEARAIAARAYAPFPWVDHETVKLLVGEAVTNAVLHAGGGWFDLICHAPYDGAVQVEVHDRSEVVPERRRHGVWDQYGRGLELLDLLAPGWAVVPDHAREESGLQAGGGSVIDPSGRLDPLAPPMTRDDPSTRAGSRCCSWGWAGPYRWKRKRPWWSRERVR
ncbi:ATP-binding protein [Streptomyces sp. NPDC087658]|uniref:ATP-binding protein n=1 Tax=Streptomyces sp. NPDC087658 TaxID=3365800 RepID=UPI0037FAB797